MHGIFKVGSFGHMDGTDIFVPLANAIAFPPTPDMPHNFGLYDALPSTIGQGFSKKKLPNLFLKQGDVKVSMNKIMQSSENGMLLFLLHLLSIWRYYRPAVKIGGGRRAVGRYP